MNEYQLRDYNNKLGILNDLNTQKSGYTFRAGKVNDEGQFSIELVGGAPIFVSYWDYKKDFSFYLDHKLQYVTYDTIKDITKDIKTPQNVHKLNARKIAEWVKFQTEVYEKAKTISAERVAKVSGFIDEFLKAGGRIRKNNNEYAPKDGQMSGEIVKNGIKYEMKVYDNAYISQDITIHYSVKDSLDTFKQLADNKYTAEA